MWVVLEGSARELPLTVDLPDGTEALALFSGEEEARMFCHFCEGVQREHQADHRG